MRRFRLSPWGGLGALAVLAVLLGVGTPGVFAADSWTTPMARKLGVELDRQFEASGPDAWDPKAHPVVFFATEGPGYNGLFSGLTNPGIVVLDAYSRNLVASQKYPVKQMGWINDALFESHGLGVSNDGRWIYLPSGDGRDNGKLLIIDARTLKLDKILSLAGRPHHAKSFIDGEGKALTMAYGWGQPLFVMDPDQDNRVVGGIDTNAMGLEGYLYFAAPEGKEIIASGRIRQTNVRRCCLHENVMIRIDTQAWSLIDYIAVPDATPIWVAFSADSRWAYFTGADTSRVFKYDRRAKGLDALRITAYQRAGVEGPFGGHLAWDDDQIWVIGKGQGSHNRGRSLGLVSSKGMSVSTRAVNQFPTGCLRGDHATLHPDPELNQFWITCNSSFEIVVFDIGEKEVSARIPMPNGGSTHSGAFVQYDGWEGEVLSDQNGLQNSALETKRKLLGITQ